VHCAADDLSIVIEHKFDDIDQCVALPGEPDDLVYAELCDVAG